MSPRLLYLIFCQLLGPGPAVGSLVLQGRRAPRAAARGVHPAPRQPTTRGPPSRPATSSWTSANTSLGSGSSSATAPGSSRPRSTRCWRTRVSRWSGFRRGVRERTASPNASCRRRTEATDRMLIFGERHLCRVLARYAVHYNRKRPHRSLELRPPRPDATVPEPIRGRIRRRPVLGGLICECRCGAPGWRTTRLVLVIAAWLGTPLAASACLVVDLSRCVRRHRPGPPDGLITSLMSVVPIGG